MVYVDEETQKEACDDHYDVAEDDESNRSGVAVEEGVDIGVQVCRLTGPST